MNIFYSADANPNQNFHFLTILICKCMLSLFFVFLQNYSFFGKLIYNKIFQFLLSDNYFTNKNQTSLMDILIYQRILAQHRS